jgi:hypothetical protein
MSSLLAPQYLHKVAGRAHARTTDGYDRTALETING